MPDLFGKYLLVDRINQGGMAEVYLAKVFGFGGTDQLVALKRIRTEVSDDPAFVEMFVNEAKLVVLLTHANIAQIFELGKFENHYYIAMEYVSGKDLRAVLDRANAEGFRLPHHLVLYMVAAVLEGLDYAHRKSDVSGKALDIVHRDVSPHNVLIGYTGDIKLIDFGIAKAANDSHSQSGVLKGKYGYMAPEQVMGKTVDARSDVFAAGVLLYELLTQTRLFDGASDFSILEKVRYAEVYPPSTVSPTIPPAVEEVVLKALSADPAERYPTASDMHDAVVEVMLQAYGTATPRELANLMGGLFGAEMKAERSILERARRLQNPAPEASPAGDALDATEEMPPPESSAADGDTEREYEMSPDVIASRLPSTDKVSPTTVRMARARSEARRPGRVAPVPGPARTRLDERVGNVNPTLIRPAYRRRIPRDTLIIAGALTVAALLVAVSWLLTRGGPGQHAGQAMILSVPPGATVILDGVMVGRTPYNARSLEVGNHTMTLEHAGYQTESRVIDVSAGEMLPVQLVLKPVAPAMNASDGPPSANKRKTIGARQ